MTIRFLMAFVASFFSLFVFSQTFKYNKKEQHFLDSLDAVIENSQELRNFFRSKCVDCEGDLGYRLGFGLSSEFIEGEIQGIYFESSFSKWKDSIIGYSLYLFTNKLKRRTVRDLEKYDSWLVLDSNQYIEPIFLTNKEFYRRPIEEYAGKYDTTHIPEYLLEYMSFEFGNDYGYFCGECKNSLTQNRSYFLLIEDSLDYEKTKLLLYSMNPASRLTATEFMYRNKENWQIDEEIYEQIDSIFGVRDSMMQHFCVLNYVSIKDEVNRYAKYLLENPSYNDRWKQSMLEWKQNGWGYFTKPD